MQEQNTTKTEGFFYVATGKTFYEETLESYKSLKQYMPEAKVTIYTDQEVDESLGFDQVVKIEEPRFSFYDKVPPILDPPYDKVVFLDTDTIIADDLSDLFVMLEQYDFAIAHASFRGWKGYEYGVPEAFAEGNSGVLAYQKNAAFREMLEEFLALYEEQLKRDAGKKSPTQPPLRAALYRATKLRILILPPEYNFRVSFPCFAGGNMRVKVIHGRGGPLFLAKRFVNRSLDARIFNFHKWSFPLRAINKLRGIKNIWSQRS